MHARRSFGESVSKNWDDLIAKESELPEEIEIQYQTNTPLACLNSPMLGETANCFYSGNSPLCEINVSSKPESSLCLDCKVINSIPNVWYVPPPTPQARSHLFRTCRKGRSEE